MAYTTFTEMEQKTDTDYSSSRSGVLDNQIDFSSSVSTSYQPSYSTLYTDTTEDEEQATNYESETEYKINDDLGGDITIVPTFMPTIERKEKEVSVHDVKLKLNARGKIIVAVFSVISVLLLSFCIYNAVLIGNLSAALTEQQAKAELVTRDVYNATSDYNGVTSTNNILASLPDGFGQGSNKEPMIVSLSERPEIVSAEASSNWFDKLCNFLSNLFN